MTSQYPMVSRSKLKGKWVGRPCSCCMQPAVWRIAIRTNWFRGDDVEALACEPHRELAYSHPDAFITQTEQHKQYMAVRIEAQHVDTGRLWAGPRRDLPRRYREIAPTGDAA